jgi:hypothetical protein
MPKINSITLQIRVPNGWATEKGVADCIIEVQMPVMGKTGEIGEAIIKNNANDDIVVLPPDAIEKLNTMSRMVQEQYQ